MKTIIILTVAIAITLSITLSFSRPIDIKNDGGIFTLRNGTKVDCQDGYTTDLCCELWAEFDRNERGEK